MVLSQINPFIRCALKLSFVTHKSYSVARDCRIFFITKGCGTVCFENKQYNFNSNTYIYIPCDTPYKLISEDTAEIMAVNFDFTAENSADALPFPVKYINNISEYKKSDNNICRPLNFPIVIENAAALFEPISKAVKEMASSKPYRQEIASAVIKEVFFSALRLSKSISSGTKPDLTIEAAKKFIKENYFENLSNQLIAQKLGYHPYHLNRIFLEAENITIHKYLINYRLKKAEQLLVETETSITEIAYSVGFNSCISFIESFKAKNKITPLKYRKMYRNIL